MTDRFNLAAQVDLLGADSMLPPEKVKRRNDDKEHRLQAFAHHYIRAVVLQPAFATAIDHAGMTTNNARARAAGRGVVFGFPDHLIWQVDGEKRHELALEFKSDKGVASERQQSVHASLRAVRVPVAVCRSIHDVLAALRMHGFALHGNAENLAVEAQARLEGAHRMRALKGPRKASKPRAEKPSAARVAAVHRSGYWRG